MRSSELAQLTAFAAVADQLSFRRAARRLGTSVSAVSRTVKALEQRVGAPLFNRTTRSVALTEAGRALADQALPALATLDRAMTSIDSSANDPAGVVRISLTQLAAQTVFAPRLGRFADAFPRIRLDLVVDDTLDDVVARGCDAGVRLRSTVAADMVATPLSGPLPTIVVGAPGYLAAHPAPVTPDDLASHRGVLYRWSADRALHHWPLLGATRGPEAMPKDQFVVSDADVMVRMAVGGAGLAFTLRARVEAELAQGTLVGVLADHCPVLPPFCLYYPAGRRPSQALRAVADAFRHRSPGESAQRPIARVDRRGAQASG